MSWGAGARGATGAGPAPACARRFAAHARIAPPPRAARHASAPGQPPDARRAARAPRPTPPPSAAARRAPAAAPAAARPAPPPPRRRPHRPCQRAAARRTAPSRRARGGAAAASDDVPIRLVARMLSSFRTAAVSSAEKRRCRPRQPLAVRSEKTAPVMSVAPIGLVCLMAGRQLRYSAREAVTHQLALPAQLPCGGRSGFQCGLPPRR